MDNPHNGLQDENGEPAMPEALSDEQLDVLRMLHESFAPLASNALTGLLARSCECKLDDSRQVSFSEYQTTLPDPGIFSILYLEPLPDTALYEISPPLYDAMLHYLLAAQGEIETPARKASDLEVIIMERLIIRMLGVIREIWNPIVQLRPRLGTVDPNPKTFPIAMPDTPGVVVRFTAQVEASSGSMSFFYPLNYLDWTRPQLKRRYGNSRVRAPEFPADKIAAVEELITEKVADKLGYLQRQLDDLSGRMNMILERLETVDPAHQLEGDGSAPSAVEDSPAAAPAFLATNQTPAPFIASHLVRERDAMIAVVLIYLPEKKRKAVFAEFTEDRRQKILKRIENMGPISRETIKDIEWKLERKMKWDAGKYEFPPGTDVADKLQDDDSNDSL